MPTEINYTNTLEVIQTNPKISFIRKEPSPDVQPFRICAVEILEADPWNQFFGKLLDDYDFIAKHSNNLHVDADGVTNALLVVNKQTDEGILVNSEGSAYARYSAYLPFAGRMLDYYVNLIADYCVTEGTLNTSDGAWAVSFDELYEHFNDVDITEDSGIDQLILQELQNRDEIAEAIQTEDGFEMTYHLEHCPQCRSGGIEAGISLLSLLGCTLENVHFIEKGGSDIIASIPELNSNMITEAGQDNWADVLSTKVNKIFNHQGLMMVELEDCDRLRVQAFAYAAKGLTDHSSEWFRDPDEPKIPHEPSEYELIDQEEFEIAYAKHILWLNDIPGGQQLDMSGCWLEGVNLSNRKLLNANFADSVLSDVNMDSAELCFADFSGAYLENTSMKYTTADEINFRGATLKQCDLSYILLAHGNFAHATFYKSDLFNCKILNSCYEGTRFVGTSTEDQYIDTDSTMTDDEWMSDNEGQVM